MGIYGANPQDLRDLASRMKDARVGLADVERALTAQIDRSPWNGADADQFRATWRGPRRATFSAASAALGEASESLIRNALDQERASGIDTAAGLSAGAAVASTLLSIPDQNASPAKVETWWRGLTDDQKLEWMRENPEMIGNRDGIPLEDRFEANRRSMVNEMARLTAGSDYSRTDYEALDMLLRQHTKVLYFDSPATSGGGYRIAVAVGDLENATSVAITVSGTGSDLDQFANNFLPETVGLIDYGSDRAAIATLVWDTPETLLDNVRIEEYTKTFVDGPMTSIVATADREFGSVILVGHSSGGVAVQEIMLGSESVREQVDGVVLLAPAAINPEIATTLDSGKIYIAMNSDDPLQEVDGKVAIYNGLEWESGYDFHDVATGEVGDLTGPNVKIASQSSGTSVNHLRTAGVTAIGGPVAGSADQIWQQTEAHGNSTYFENYGDDALDFVLGNELANQDDLSF